jgi:hypothetical protein
MATSDDAKVGLSILEEVAEKIEELYGTRPALNRDRRVDPYDPIFDADNAALQKQLDAVEKKIGDAQEHIGYINFLRGRLTAVRQTPVHNRKMLKCGQYYQKAIDLGYHEPQVRFFWAFHYFGWGKTDKAIQQMQWVVDSMGVDSELGMEAAKQIEKFKAAKGWCFIATAAYGSPLAAEVDILRHYRDEILIRRGTGRGFVHVYYLLSPPFAKIVENSDILRFIVRVLLKKLIHHAESKLELRR